MLLPGLNLRGNASQAQVLKSDSQQQTQHNGIISGLSWDLIQSCFETGLNPDLFFVSLRRSNSRDKASSACGSKHNKEAPGGQSIFI